MLAAACLLPAATYALTNVSGNITTQTWGAAGSPYRVTGAITVPAGNVLSIDPNVDVLFDVDEVFTVLGTVEAVGTEADSIRFLPGSSAEWGGIRFGSADTSTLHYVRVSGGVANGEAPYDDGGGIYASTCKLGMSNCVISGNAAVGSDGAGGGVYIRSGAYVTMHNTTVTGNSAQAWGGGVYVTGSTLIASESAIDSNVVTLATAKGVGLCALGASSVDLRQCSISANVATAYGTELGGGVYATGAGTEAYFERCVIAENVAGYGGAIYTGTGSAAEVANCTITGNGDNGLKAYDGVNHYAGSTITIWNTILWGNGTNDIAGAGTAVVSYSDVGVGATGDGVFSADPQFTDAASGDYSISIESPCVDAGNPDGPYDPDLSNADLGAFTHDHGPALRLGNYEVVSGDAVEIAVLANTGSFYGVEFAFTLDTAFWVPADPFITGDEVAAQGGSTEWSTTEDTVFVASASASAIEVSETLMTLHLKLKHNVETDVTVPLNMVWDRVEVDETGINSYDGNLTISLVYGDVTTALGVTVDDASLILQRVVGYSVAMDEVVADVSDNGAISAYDAALVLYKVVNPAYDFPCVDKYLERPSAACERFVMFEKHGDVWSLLVNDAEGIASGSFTIVLPEGAVADVSASGIVAARQQDGVLEVAFARVPSDDAVLFEISGLTCCGPAMVAGALNEGLIALSEGVVSTPATLSLSQNSPNPFNPTTTLRFSMPGASDVHLAVYNTAGQLVRTLVDGNVAAGEHSVAWDGRDASGRDVASGIYIYRLTSGHGAMTRRMTLLR